MYPGISWIVVQNTGEDTSGSDHAEGGASVQGPPMTRALSRLYCNHFIAGGRDESTNLGGSVTFSNF